MAKKTKKVVIKPLEDYLQLSDVDIVHRATAAVTGRAWGSEKRPCGSSLAWAATFIGRAQCHPAMLPGHGEAVSSGTTSDELPMESP